MLNMGEDIVNSDYCCRSTLNLRRSSPNILPTVYTFRTINLSQL